MKSCSACLLPFCSKCIDYSLILNEKAAPYCEKCFVSASDIDFTKNVEIVGKAKGDAISIIFVHGAGGCRNMFLPHAQALSDRYSCTLIDLPGHGSKMKESLSIDSAIAVIMDALNQHCATHKGTKPVLIGASLGGYISAECIGKYPDSFSSSIIMMAGQTVGVGRGWMAWLGLLAFHHFIPLVSATTLLSGMQSATKNGSFRDDLIKHVLGAGFFFHNSTQQVEILRQSNPVAGFKRFNKPILMMDGSKDHHDNHDRILNSTNKVVIKIWEGGDHFFSHDERFYNDILVEIDTFIKTHNDSLC
jgi:pimeloyl-ACP methyl ester carboxylesterase